MKLQMKSFLLAIVLFMAFTVVEAQIETPQPSPTATFSQKVGLTDVKITYSRPSVKGRKIFGDLVPYGQLWRTGANMATKFEFSDDVKIEGQDIPAGTYALFTIPGEEEWTVIFNKNWQQGGTGNYKEEEDAIRFTVKPGDMPMSVETLVIDINNVTSTSSSI